MRLHTGSLPDVAQTLPKRRRINARITGPPRILYWDILRVRRHILLHALTCSHPAGPLKRRLLISGLSVQVRHVPPTKTPSWTGFLLLEVRRIGTEIRLVPQLVALATTCSVRQCPPWPSDRQSSRKGRTRPLLFGRRRGGSRCTACVIRNRTKLFEFWRAERVSRSTVWWRWKMEGNLGNVPGFPGTGAKPYCQPVGRAGQPAA